MGGLVVEPSQILWHRLRVNHLARRAPAGTFAAAAYAGLQDSAPRAALTSLSARVEDVTTAAWEHQSLVQTWAPRGAVFVVPRSDLAVFALGIAPRDPELRQALTRLATRARESIGEPRRDEGRAEAARLGPLPPIVLSAMRRRPIWRLVCALAGVQVRWDARSTQLLGGAPLELDEEVARRELARRFLRSLGPASQARFTRWAAVGAADATTTFEALGDELLEVRWTGGSGLMLADDAERLAHAEPVIGVRFIAFGGDPVLQPGEVIVAADRSHRKAALPPWACTGLVLLDAAVVASWGRSQRRVTIHPLSSLDRTRQDQIEAEALRMPIAPAGPDVVWRPGR